MSGLKQRKPNEGAESDLKADLSADHAILAKVEAARQKAADAAKRAREAEEAAARARRNRARTSCCGCCR